MFAAAVVALYSTFGPIAQDAQSLYVVQNDSVVRVSKDDPAQRTTLTPPVSRRIAALDVDGDRLFYATAPAPRCVEVPVTPSMLYVAYRCSLSDTDLGHRLMSISLFGGDEKTVATNSRSMSSAERNSFA